MSHIRLYFAIILIFFGLTKCDYETPIPEVPINLTIHLSNPLYSDLNSVSNSVYVPNQGYKGLIITRTSFDEFTVYDACCTYNPNDPKSVVEIKEIFGVCKSCGSKFGLMSWGYVEKGPATYSLKTYHVKYNQSAQSLYIHN